MPTIGGTALSNAARVGGRDAVVAGDRRWTWRALDIEIARAAGTLDALGLRKGDRLAILCGNSPEFIIASHAGARLGAIVVPVNTRLATPEVAHILSDSGGPQFVPASMEARCWHSARQKPVSLRVRAMHCLVWS